METVLRHRKNIEEKWQREVAKTLYEIVMERERLSRNREHRNEAALRMRRGLDRGMNVQNTCLYQDYIRGMDQTIKENMGRINNLEKTLAQKRKKLIQASKEKKAVEKMKEIFIRRTAEEARRVETKQLDEMAINRHRLQAEGG